MGSEEFINRKSRWCLWLQGVTPNELRKLPHVRSRVERVRDVRVRSRRSTTNALAATPALFGEIRQPTSSYLAMPEVSSESRRYIPSGFLASDVIATNKLYTVTGAGLYELGILASGVHMAWVRTVCGRLKSDFQSSAGIVYNNFPWPESPTDKQRAAVERGAQGVLDTRAQFPDASLADLYDPLTMPPALVTAHQTLDAAVDAAYGRKGFRNDAERVAFLFELHQKYTSLLPSIAPKARARKAARTARSRGT
jgi:hypothetical protein